MADGEQQDPEQKTEDPSARRLEEAKKRGQLITSREIHSFFLMALLTGLVVALFPSMLQQAGLMLRPYLERPDLMATDPQALRGLLVEAAINFMLVVALPLVGAVVVIFAASYMQHGNVFTADPLMPKLERISPMAGWGRIFSMRSVVEMIKGIIKITIVTYAMWYAIKADVAQLKSLPDDGVVALLIFLSKVVFKVLLAVCIAMFFIALVDYSYQRHEYMKSMRMTKQELRDEYKQQEGDPMIKQRLKQIRMEKARQRMMAEVPKADVVITNPTHYAVALKYDNATMKAPVVVAKGVDFVAKTIREVAEKNGVTLMRNPPLARALYDSVDLDEEIPAEHYKAVAEIITYVYKLKGRLTKRPGV